MRTPIVVTHGAATHTGLRRSLNEDSFVATAPLFFVADGMGGHEAGDVASTAVVESFCPLVGRTSITLDDLRFALARARATIDGLGADGESRAGTTLTGVAVASVDGTGYWLVVNIGDSRTYRLTGTGLERLTIDHSVVQELIDAGEIDESDAHDDRRRNIITRAIGAGSVGEADYWMVPAEVGDRAIEFVLSDRHQGKYNLAPPSGEIAPHRTLGPRFLDHLGRDVDAAGDIVWRATEVDPLQAAPTNVRSRRGTGVNDLSNLARLEETEGLSKFIDCHLGRVVEIGIEAQGRQKRAGVGVGHIQISVDADHFPDRTGKDERCAHVSEITESCALLRSQGLILCIALQFPDQMVIFSIQHTPSHLHAFLAGM